MIRRLFFFLLIPFAAWSGSDYLFVFYDHGESVALLPLVDALRKKGESVDVLEYGDLSRDVEVDKNELLDSKVLITGTASKVQLQYMKHCSGRKIAYYDNPLEIDKTSYAWLIREFEKVVDEFWVSSQIAASSSMAKDVFVVGNPNFDPYFELNGKDSSGSTAAFFAGYDECDKAALQIFLDGCVAGLFNYDQIFVCPHPKTDGSLEKELVEKKGLSNVKVLDVGGLSSVEVVAQSVSVFCHRSSMAVKALLAGREVICINPDGSYEPFQTTVEELGIPCGALEKMLERLGGLPQPRRVCWWRR